MDIHVAADFVCPWCYIGKRQLENALQEKPGVGVSVRHLPFELNPSMPPEGMDRNAYLLARFGTIDRSGAETALKEAAKASGLTFDFTRIRRVPNTMAAHRLMRLAPTPDEENRLAESIFRAYFVEGQDIGDTATLLSLAAAENIEARHYLLSEEGTAEVRHEEAMLRDIGISGVPFTIIDRKFTVSGAAGSKAFRDAIDRAAAMPTA